MSLNKLLAALLVIVFVFFGLAILLAWSVQDNLLNADSYIEALDRADFFQVPYQLIRDGNIPQAGGLLLQEGPLSAVSGPELEAIARELAPPDWLRAQLERAIRDFISVVDSPESDELPGVLLSLREVKARALSEPGERALSIVVQALPVCAPGRAPLDMNSDTPVCTPADIPLSSFVGRLKSLLEPLVARVPDTYRVSWQPEQKQVLEDLRRAGRTLNQLQFGLLLLVALDLALLGLIWLLAVRSTREWLRWTGMPLLLLGLLALSAALLLPRVVSWGLDNQALWAEGDVPASLAAALEDAILGMALLLFQPARWASVALVAAGLLLTLISPLFPGRRHREFVPA